MQEDKPTLRQRFSAAVKAFMHDAAEPSLQRNARAFFDRRSTRPEDELVGTWERDQIIAQTRDLARNNSIVSGLLTRLADMTVGNGIVPHPVTTDEAWNDAAGAYWEAWARDPEGRGIASLRDVLALCVTGIPLEGGAAIVKHRDGNIEQVELVRFRPAPDEPLPGKCWKTDASGRITHWCIWRRDTLGKFTDKNLWRWVKAEDVLTLFKRIRPDQVMPVGELAPVVNTLRDMKELHDYTLQQAKVQSIAALIHQKQDDDDVLPVRSRKADASRQLEQEAAFDRLAEAAGMPIISTRGDVKTLAPATPSSTYDAFQAYNLKVVAMAMSIPLDVLMMFFSDGTYASSKATLCQAHETIKHRQAVLVERLLRPLWLWKIAGAVADGDLPPPPLDKDGFPQYDWVEFLPPAFEWMDAQDQTQTDAQEITMGVKTLAEVARKHGHDLYDVLEARAREIREVERIAARYGLNPAQLSQVVISGAANVVPPDAAETRQEGANE